MTVQECAKLVNAEIVTGEEFCIKEVESVCASDLLSDVLATHKHNFLLVTGLCTPQVVRTAELMSSVGVLFVRGKYPQQEAIGMSKVHNIPLLCTSKDMFEACCLLAGKGLETPDRTKAL